MTPEEILEQAEAIYPAAPAMFRDVGTKPENLLALFDDDPVQACKLCYWLGRYRGHKSEGQQ